MLLAHIVYIMAHLMSSGGQVWTGVTYIQHIHFRFHFSCNFPPSPIHSAANYYWFPHSTTDLKGEIQSYQTTDFDYQMFTALNNRRNISFFPNRLMGEGLKRDLQHENSINVDIFHEWGSALMYEYDFYKEVFRALTQVSSKMLLHYWLYKAANPS